MTEGEGRKQAENSLASDSHLITLSSKFDFTISGLTCPVRHLKAMSGRRAVHSTSQQENSICKRLIEKQYAYQSGDCLRTGKGESAAGRSENMRYIVFEYIGQGAMYLVPENNKEELALLREYQKDFPGRVEQIAVMDSQLEFGCMWWQTGKRPEKVRPVSRIRSRNANFL